MRGELVGIISEGAEDYGVLKNILRAVGFDGSEIIAIRPSLNKSPFDKHEQQQTIGTFQGVKNACEGKNGERPDFERFFKSQLDAKYMVVQIDTAEIDRQNFSFTKPTKENNLNYSHELRAAAIELINNWLSSTYSDKLFYAIAIEELEAWCLTIFENEETTHLNNLKQRLEKHLQRKNLTYRDLKCHPTTGKSLYFETFTKKFNFHKLETLRKYADKNPSLNAFIASVEQRLTNNE